MWFFKKKHPAALRKDGLTQLITVFLLCIFIFIPAFALSPILAEIGMGWLFFEDEKMIETFNIVYAKHVKGDEGYFYHLFKPFNPVNYSMFDSFKFFLLAVLSLWVIYLYIKLIFIDKFSPFFIHPNSVKKGILRSSLESIKYNLKNNKIDIINGLFWLVVFILFFPKLYFHFWEWFSGINQSNYKIHDSSIFDYLAYIYPCHVMDITAKFIIPFFLIWSWLSFGITWKIIKESKPYRKLSSLGRPAARWGGVASYISHDFDELIKGNKNEFYESTEHKNPIYLGTTTFTSDPRIGGRHFGLDTDSHMLTIAQTGSGKSRDVLHTNLAIWRHGLFVLDPKGEHAQRTYQLRKEAGFPVYIIDPYGLCSDIKETDCINLLEEIDPNAPSAADDIQTITYACIPPDAKETGGSKHFRETAQMLFSGLVAHVLTRFPKEEQTLTTVFDLFLSGKPDGTLIHQEGFYKILGEMAGNPSCGKLPMQAVAMLLNVPAGERGSIYSTFMRSVAWTQSESIKHILSKSTFNLDEIRSNKATIYLVLPFGYMRPQARWIRAIIGLCFKRAEFPATITDTSKKSLFVLDEFLQLETCKAVEDSFLTSRGAGVKIWLLSQSLSDIKEYYAKHKSMISACDKQFFGTDDIDDTQYLEEFLGEYENIIIEGNKNEPRTQREINKLSTASAIRGTIEKSEAGEGYQIVKPTNGLPVVLNLVPCYWIINKDRYGDFQQKILPPYQEPEAAPEKEQEFLSPEKVMEILRGDSHTKSKSSATSGIPKTGEKTPLRRDIDKLQNELKELKESINDIKNKIE